MVPSIIRNNSQSLILLLSIFIGSIIGIFFPELGVSLKPIGDLFLNLLFTIVVPLIFFSISSSVAQRSSAQRLKAITLNMLPIFVLLSLCAAIFMLGAVLMFPSVTKMAVTLTQEMIPQTASAGELFVKAISVSDFFEMLSRKNILALIIFSLLFGLAVSSLGKTAEAMKQFLTAGQAVSIKIISYVMLIAPLGLGSYFAYLVGVLGAEVLSSYVKTGVFYYVMAGLYFCIGFSFYAFLGGSWAGVYRFWKNIFPTAITAFATGSSVAAIPSNLEAARKMGIPGDIREIVIPTATSIHKQGSCLLAILKIALLFSLFDMHLSSWDSIFIALGIAVLCGTAIGGIPSGGVIGEMLIITLYGFPPEAFPIVSMLGALADPPATMLNAVGANAASMLVARRIEGVSWAGSNSDMAADLA